MNGECSDKVTACDKCDLLEACKSDKLVMESEEHYVLPMGAYCQKEPMGKAEVAYRKYKKSFEEHIVALIDGKENVELYAQESAKRHAEMLNELEKLFYGG